MQKRITNIHMNPIKLQKIESIKQELQKRKTDAMYSKMLHPIRLSMI